MQGFILVYFRAFLFSFSVVVYGFVIRFCQDPFPRIDRAQWPSVSTASQVSGTDIRHGSAESGSELSVEIKALGVAPFCTKHEMSNKLSLLAIYKTPRQAPHFATLFSCQWIGISWLSGHGMYVRLSLTGVRVGFEVGGSVEVAPCGAYRAYRFLSGCIYVARK